MEPITHFLTGACLARTGLNRRSAYATLTMVLAAEAPDLDTLWSIRGPIANFTHHRGYTHTVLGLPVDAAVVLGAVWLWHRWRTRHHRDPNLAPPGTPEERHERKRHILPIRWGELYLFALLALMSHLLLDWTNNYGLRPFFPFNPRWYAGSFVFIVEPVMLALLILGLVAPPLFGLIGSEIGARREPFRGRGWASFALAGVVLLWCLRGYERLHAEDLARRADFGSADIQRSTVSPYPINPFRWHGVVETLNFYQLSTVDSLSGQVATNEQNDLIYKPAETRATLAAKKSPLGRAYLDWSPFPLVTENSLSTPEGFTVVTFRDLRFLYDTLGMHGREESPLAGQVTVNQADEVIRMALNGHPGQ
jgi:inner membrane protein